jgi:predicted GIY-YIG superfamily endonuclease
VSYQQPCEVYRLHDKHDRLLYIGVSIQPERRIRSYSFAGKTGKEWWPEVASCSLERFPNYSAALDAERAAIKDERPLYNKRSALPPIRHGLGWPDTARGVVV